MLTAVERVLILKRADLLAGVRPRHLLGLAHLAQEIEIARGQTLYREEDTADVLYLVVEGRVRLSTGERTTSEVGPGEAFGTWALVDDARRGQSSVALEDGVVLSLRRSDFYEEAAGDVTLLQEVIRVLARRLRALVTDRPEEARVEPEGQPADEPESKGEAPRSA